MAALVGILALVLAACGGEASNSSSETAEGASDSAAQAVNPTGCDEPTEVKGFLTCADVDKAIEEATVVYYSPSPEQAQLALFDKFTALFPDMEMQSIRLNTGALYARLLAEREAGAYLADVIMIADQQLTTDFHEQGGYEPYLSPELEEAYPEQAASDPPGWGTVGIVSGGIAYNPEVLEKEGIDPPETWEDLLNPALKGRINFKQATSGIQFRQWHALRELYGDEFWDEMAEQDPIALDSYVTQYERAAAGEDLVVGNAEYGGYLAAVKDGAPLEFVAPDTGLPAVPVSAGVVENPVHPEAARLFYDWLLSEQGQEVFTGPEYNVHSLREGIEPPEGALPTEELNFLIPEDWTEMFAARDEFQEVWARLSGITVE